MTSTESLFLGVYISLGIGIVFFIWASIQALKESLNKALIEKKELELEKTRPKKVKIINCSSQFYWYEKLSRESEIDLKTGLPDPDKVKKKIFEVENFLTHEIVEGPFRKTTHLYRTIANVAGPGVKGFIHPQDVVIMESEYELKQRLRKEKLKERDKWIIHPFSALMAINHDRK